MAVDFASDMQQELNYFAGPQGLGVDAIYTDCTRTSRQWLQLMCDPDAVWNSCLHELLCFTHARLFGGTMCLAKFCRPRALAADAFIR